MVGIFTDSLCIGTLATVVGNYSAGIYIFYGYYAQTFSAEIGLMWVKRAVAVVPIAFAYVAFHVTYAVVSPDAVTGMGAWACVGCREVGIGGHIG